MSVKQPLTVKIPIKNRQGEVVSEREVVSYAGLLAKAHDEGLESIETTLVQTPTEANGNVAIVRALVRGRFGAFTGLGDADVSNVNRAVARHLVRIAETRAKARALRDAINVGVVSLEELSGDDEAVAEPLPETTGAAMSAAQHRVLIRLAARLGHENEAVHSFIAKRAGIRDGRVLTRREASRLIDELDAELKRKGGHRAA